jgi:hypothetical protein
MKKIITEAHEQRFKDVQEEEKKDTIMITNKWYEELKKYPFVSSKYIVVDFVESNGKAIFLMKQRSKVFKAKKQSKVREVKTRLS